MLKRLKGAAVGCAALAIVSTAAFAAGYFPGFPIVGGAAYCQGTSSYSTSVTVPGTLPTPNNCNSLVPAGPSIITGNELIPADTGLGNQAPATVYIPIAALGALPPAYPVFGNGTATNTFTVSPNVGTVILSSATGLLSSTTMTFPASPIDGQKLNVSSTGTITTFAVSANIGQSSFNNPTVLTASTTGSYGYEWIYRAANTSWYRLQ
jgi:hypothetical protein